METNAEKSNMIEKFIAKLTFVMFYISAIWIMVIMAWIVVDVLSRVIFNAPLLGTPEVASNSIAAIAFLQIPFVLLQNGHIRSTMVVERMGIKAWSDVLTCVLGIILFSLAFISSIEPTITSWVIGEYEGEGALRVPSYPIKTIILIGTGLMVVQFTINFLRILSDFVKKRRKGAGTTKWIL